eukprot:CAMPEP_0172552200 /NCGR_PEP_ID=MMETSP1067-20121228/43682_1 /TAXON_ID=265564 ORGANISM="Thalassiosira punctigera, Strain Tpunct2005C2" /NCGR_SAMPLE_ID=MMETSP1067 /ASSEMBLY_ACC=CAM_ASM_000444 /LENGTH=316 /DNA_ID=CAMNT_0013340127 /DNA_START=63 /DNA_END=1013 /DNA_ORIENTATION=+
MARHLPPFLLAALALSRASAFTSPNHHGSIPSAAATRRQRRSSSSSLTALSVRRMPIVMPTQEPMVPYRAPGSSYDQFIGLQSRQLRDRKLWIARYIDEEASNSIISSLLYLQSESDKEDIKLYLNIPGANLRPALAIYDALSELKADGCKIATTNVALCAGMGALLAGAGTKGMRYSLPNARYLLQKTGMDVVFRGQATDIALEVKNVKRWNEKINAELSKVTGQPSERIDEDMKRDFYLSSEEAVRYGLIDEVLLPMPNKRQPPTEVVDLGSFMSGEENKFQGERPPPSGQEQQQQNAGMMRTNDDDEPPVGKA